MQCRDAHFFLRLRRQANDELGSDVSADLDRHLAGCPECALDSQIVQSFDSAVASAMKSVAVPMGLRDKLLSQAMSQRGTVIRRKVYQLAALAASLFLIVGVSFGIFSASRPRLDTEILVNNTDELIQNSNTKMNQWLAAQNFPTELPLPFNTDLIYSLGHERIQGKDVPVILFGAPPERGFANERGFAKLYLFHENSDFKLDKQTLRNADASNAHAKVLTGQGKAAGVVYIVVYTTHDLEPFMQHSTNQA
jgi:hypothetical protein